MSASNWKLCPACWHEAQEQARTEREAVMATYGQVPVEQFDAARAALTEPDRDDYVTLREDYGFVDAETGTLRITYKCGCTKCGLNTKVDAVKPFWPVSGPLSSGA